MTNELNKEAVKAKVLTFINEELINAYAGVDDLDELSPTFVKVLDDVTQGTCNIEDVGTRLTSELGITIVTDAKEVPGNGRPDAIYINGTFYDIGKKNWRKAYVAVCKYCLDHDESKFRSLNISGVVDRVVPYKEGMENEVTKDGDYYCIYGLWFYLRINGKECAKLIFKTLEFMGITDYALLVKQK